MTLKLYDYPLSGHAHRLRLFLSLLGLEYERVVVDMLKGEHKAPEYVKLSPLGQVPTLVDGDVVITDSTAGLDPRAIICSKPRARRAADRPRASRRPAYPANRFDQLAHLEGLAHPGVHRVGRDLRGHRAADHDHGEPVRARAHQRLEFGAIQHVMRVRASSLREMYTDEGMFSRAEICSLATTIWNWSFHFGSGNGTYQTLLFAFAGLLVVAFLLGIGVGAGGWIDIVLGLALLLSAVTVVNRARKALAEVAGEMK